MRPLAIYELGMVSAFILVPYTGEPGFRDWVRQRGIRQAPAATPGNKDRDASPLGRIIAGERVVSFVDVPGDEGYRPPTQVSGRWRRPAASGAQFGWRCTKTTRSWAQSRSTARRCGRFPTSRLRCCRTSRRKRSSRWRTRGSLPRRARRWSSRPRPPRCCRSSIPRPATSRRCSMRCSRRRCGYAKPLSASLDL